MLQVLALELRLDLGHLWRDSRCVLRVALFILGVRLTDVFFLHRRGCLAVFLRDVLWGQFWDVGVTFSVQLASFSLELRGVAILILLTAHVLDLSGCG